jgi:hypothetical protein
MFTNPNHKRTLTEIQDFINQLTRLMYVAIRRGDEKGERIVRALEKKINELLWPLRMN